MKAKNDFEKLLNDLRAIPADRVREPDLAVATLIQEAFDLATTAAEHSAVLVAAGLPMHFVDSLTPRANALRATQTAWTHARDTAAPVAYTAEIDYATVIRRDFAATSRFALRHDNRAQATIDRIQDGEGVADMCQDLVDLAALAEAHPGDFEKTDFDTATIGKARKAADSLLALHATVTGERAGTSKAAAEAKDLRDRAATYLDEAVDEVRAAGLYAFRNDSDGARLALFRSAAAIQKGRRKRAAAKKASNSTSPAAPAAAAPTGQPK